MELKVRQRIALSLFFFLSGLCFSSWTSRIPNIKTALNLNEAELGSVLFAMPISSLLGLPLSGWLVEKYDSRHPLVWAFVFHSLFLLAIGFSNSVFLFTGSIFMFALSMRILNISMNTQSITLQKNFAKKINGSFHGLWSLGGIAGIGITTLMVALEVGMKVHFLIVSVLVILITLFAYNHLLKGDRTTSPTKLAFRKPDPHIMLLGFIIFCAALCEGSMFDWSGVFFKEVLNVEIFTAGYLVFMICMATSRFLSDWLIHRLGMPLMFVISSLLITSGICLAILFPYFWTAMVGFSLVGMGTASIVPMIFTLAGTSKKYSPGMAISLIATYAIVGMLIGPPLIGYIAHALNLRFSFILIALAGIMMIPISRMFFRIRQ